jgi:hypothetical protein
MVVVATTPSIFSLAAAWINCRAPDKEEDTGIDHLAARCGSAEQCDVTTILSLQATALFSDFFPLLDFLSFSLAYECE